MLLYSETASASSAQIGLPQGNAAMAVIPASSALLVAVFGLFLLIWVISENIPGVSIFLINSVYCFSLQRLLGNTELFVVLAFGLPITVLFIVSQQ